MTYLEAFEAWSNSERPAVEERYGKDDDPALSESWNNFTDYLCKEGELTATQYQYCPSYDDVIPDDTAPEIEYLLEALGVTIEAATRCENPNWQGDPLDTDMRHFLVTIHRGSKSMEVPFSMGPKAGDRPEAIDVIYCLHMDATNAEEFDTFEEFAEEFSIDADSRRAERQYKEQIEQSKAFRAFFADVGEADMAAMFEDY